MNNLDGDQQNRKPRQLFGDKGGLTANGEDPPRALASDTGGTKRA